jgi:hypothetical protein
MTLTAAMCATCGAPNLGTRFCESCGATMARASQVATDGAPPAPTDIAVLPGVRGAPRSLFLGGIGGSAAFSILLTWLLYNSNYSAAVVIVFDLLIVACDALSVVGLLLASRRGSTRLGLKVGGLILILLVPAADIVILIGDSLNNYGFAFSGVSTGFIILSITTVLAWIMAVGLPGRSYFSLFIPFGAGVLSSLVGRFGAGALGTALAATAIVVAVLLASRIKPRGVSTPSYASPALSAQPPAAQTTLYAPAGSNTTNGFAIAALITGLLGGTVLPIIFGHVAHSQIRRTGQAGWGMATAGLVLGYICTAAVVVVVVIILAAQAPHYY